MTRHLFRIRLFLLASAFLAGCQGLSGAFNGLEPAATDFVQRLRWRDFAGAARHLEEPCRQEFLDRFGAIEDLDIADVRVLRVTPLGEDRTEILLEMEYFRLPSPRLEKLRVQQLWEREPGEGYRRGVWRIVTPFPPLPERTAGEGGADPSGGGK